jgi:hypothetical protein
MAGGVAFNEDLPTNREYEATGAVQIDIGSSSVIIQLSFQSGDHQRWYSLQDTVPTEGHFKMFDCVGGYLDLTYAVRSVLCTLHS